MSSNYIYVLWESTDVVVGSTLVLKKYIGQPHDALAPLAAFSFVYTQQTGIKSCHVRPILRTYSKQPRLEQQSFEQNVFVSFIGE